MERKNGENLLFRRPQFTIIKLNPMISNENNFLLVG